MKTLIKCLIILLSITAIRAQDNTFDIKTRSVEINDIISFIINTYGVSEIDPHALTFLIQVHDDNLPGEQLVMLKQAFKLLSERLNEDSVLSLGTYSGFNGIALGPTNVKEIELILHTLIDLKGNIAEFYEDGLALAYQHAEETFDENARNELIIIRAGKKAKNAVVDIQKEEMKAKRKKKRDAIMVTALALLPEIIDLIKN